MSEFDRGFKDGVANWEVFLQCPITRKCTIYVAHTGEMTEAGIDRVIEILNLVKDKFAEPVASNPAKIQEAK